MPESLDLNCAPAGAKASRRIGPSSRARKDYAVKLNSYRDTDSLCVRLAHREQRGCSAESRGGQCWCQGDTRSQRPPAQLSSSTAAARLFRRSAAEKSGA